MPESSATDGVGSRRVSAVIARKPTVQLGQVAKRFPTGHGDERAEDIVRVAVKAVTRQARSDQAIVMRPDDPLR